MSTPDQILQYQYLWDGSQPGWVLLLIHGHKVDLSLQFDMAGPSARELIAVRKTVSEFQAMPLHQVVAKLQGIQSLQLGRFESKEAREISASCRSAGLNVLEGIIDISGYFPRNLITGMALLIEDRALAQRVCDAALLHGVAVRCIEV